MINYLLRWMLVLSGLFTLPMLLIRAQPYDDSELRAFLTPPEGCPAPCFIGIRPGVTTADEATAILREHEWVAATVKSVIGDEMYVTWDDYSHPLVDQERTAAIRHRNGVIQTITVSTRLRLSDILATYGPPTWGQVVPVYGSSRSTGFAYQIAYRPDWPLFEFIVLTRKRSGKLVAVLNANIIMNYGVEPDAGGSMNPSLADFMGLE